MISKLRQMLRSDLEAPASERYFGAGWLSGTAGLVAGLAGLFFVLCLRFPALLTVPNLRSTYDEPWFRLLLHFLLLAAFALSIVSLMLRTNKILGFAGMAVTLLATVLGGSRVPAHGEVTNLPYLGLDWFVLNLAFTGILFIPLERLFPKYESQPLFRFEWREDLFYFLVSSLFVQVLSLLSLAPANTILAHTNWTSFRAWVGSQWLWLQVLEIMFLTDFVQYWVHRAFHQFSFLWGFHAVHHSARNMDWMASARMHLFEIIILRGTTVIPMFIFGFSEFAMYAYLLLVYFHSSFVHANVQWDFNRIAPYLVTPRFHHWHHGLDKEAIDINFAIHFPLFDRLFGTYHLPESKWPSGYGVLSETVPSGYWKQFCHPFVRKRH